jgi:hypothetical protein
MIKDKYFIKINPAFMFDEYEVFETNYTPWVYLSLKLKYKYYLEHAPYKTFTIDKTDMAGYYATSPQTIYTAVNDLKKAGLLEEKKRKYRLIDEQEYLTKFRKVDTVIEKKYPDFIRVYNNYYEDLLLDIKKEILPLDKDNTSIMKCMKIYFYLIARNNHSYSFHKVPIMKSDLTQTSIETETGIDHRVIKFLLSLLNDRGYIKMEDRTIYTLNKKLYEPSKRTFQKSVDEYSSEPTSSNIASISSADSIVTKVNDIKSVPKSFVGYCKTIDGKLIQIINYDKNMIHIRPANWCKADGIPPTIEEFRITMDLMRNGKKSRYYDPKSFWLYKQEVLSLKRAA